MQRQRGMLHQTLRRRPLRGRGLRLGAQRLAAGPRSLSGLKAKPMFKLFLEMSMLAFEAQQAIWLRGMKLAAGGSAAEREAGLMVSEKVSAGQDAFFKAATGKAPLGIVRGYRRKVRANVRRLSKMR